MNGNERDVTENDLLAYVDGELDEDARARVERHLAVRPADAALVEEWMRQNGRLNALYGPIAGEAVPPRLQPALMATRRHPVLGARPARRLAAAVALLALGAGSGWFGHALVSGGSWATEPLVAEAVQAHDLYAGESLHPVEVRADGSGQLQDWLRDRLDRDLTVPDLRADGLTLVGGRLLPAAGGAPAGQLMYEDASGRRLTLYVVPTARGEESAFHYASLEGLGAIFWEDEDVKCAFVGDMPRERLRSIARAAYRQLI